jgi:putative alpha-1,2-mannosidase
MLIAKFSRMSLCKGFTQGGSNADVVLADSYLKNITNGINWATGYEAVLSDAEGKNIKEWVKIDADHAI